MLAKTPYLFYNMNAIQALIIQNTHVSKTTIPYDCSTTHYTARMQLGSVWWRMYAAWFSQQASLIQNKFTFTSLAAAKSNSNNRAMTSCADVSPYIHEQEL